jgi:hypothetical protein
MGRTKKLANGERLPPLKERARQVTIYLEPDAFDQLREIAFTERTKMHPLVLEGIEMMMAKRSIRMARNL